MTCVDIAETAQNADTGPNTGHLKRGSQRFAAVMLVGVSAVCGVFGLITVTAADRLIDGGYDNVIAIASGAAPIPTQFAADAQHTRPGVFRLTATNAVTAAVPTAATEHAWLTGRTQHVEATTIASTTIASTVGARFTVSGAGISQTLEVVDVREVPADHLLDLSVSVEARSSAASSGQSSVAPSRMLLVACRIVGDETASARLVRFLVPAEPMAIPTIPPRSPGLL